jgi:hypothetical protein
MIVGLIGKRDPARVLMGVVDDVPLFVGDHPPDKPLRQHTPNDPILTRFCQVLTHQNVIGHPLLLIEKEGTRCSMLSRSKSLFNSSEMRLRRPS